jgi:hypothetical protein
MAGRWIGIVRSRTQTMEIFFIKQERLLSNYTMNLKGPVTKSHPRLECRRS